MIATKQLPMEVKQELANEFAAGLDARAAIMREAIDEIAQQPSADAAQRLRLTAHSLVGTASAFGAGELVPHAERLESLGRTWQSERGVAQRQSIIEAQRELEFLTLRINVVVERLRRR